jgi:hypothetical protein
LRALTRAVLPRRAAQSARELVRQRLAEQARHSPQPRACARARDAALASPQAPARPSLQGAGAALDALCPEFAERLLPRLLAGDTVPSLIEARVSAPDDVRENDAGFVRASWGAVPPGLLSPLRGTPRVGGAAAGGAAPPPASPAAFAAQLSALVHAGEWDVADMLTDNRGILVATFWADVLLLSRAVASGVQGRIAAALSSAPTGAPVAQPAVAGQAPSTPPAPRAAPAPASSPPPPAPPLTLEPTSPAKAATPAAAAPPSSPTPSPAAIAAAAIAAAAPTHESTELEVPSDGDTEGTDADAAPPTPAASEDGECTPEPEEVVVPEDE